MINLSVIAEQLFNSVKGRFGNLTIGDENGDVTNVPTEARFFDFDFGPQQKPIGKVSISLDEENGIAIIYNKDMIDENYGQHKQDWFSFLKDMRMFSKKRLLKFEVRDITRTNLQKRDYKFLATNRPGDNTMSESKMYGTHKTSFQKFGSAKLSIKHNGTIDEGESRNKKIGSIFIENSDGEKFKYPFKHLSGARAMAKHIGEGGHPFDDFGKHISGLSEELSKLRKFNQYMNRSSVMAETLSEYTGTVKERMGAIKKEINNLQKPAYYAEALDNFTPAQVNEVPSEVAENWIDQLTVKQFNEELKDVFPYIYNLVSESTLAETVNPEDLLSEFNLGKAIGLPQGVKPDDFVKKAMKISQRYEKLAFDNKIASDLNRPFNGKQGGAFLIQLYMELINMSREIQKLGGGNKTMVNAQQQMSLIRQAMAGPVDNPEAIRVMKAAPVEPKFIIDFVKQDIQSIGNNESQELEEAEDTYHKVAPGETIFSIAQQYIDHFPGGVQQGVDEIMNANGINNPKLIQVGTELVIPLVAKDIGASPTTPGATRGIDPKDNYSPDDFKRLTNPSMEQAFENAIEDLMGQFAEQLNENEEDTEEGSLDALIPAAKEMAQRRKLEKQWNQYGAGIEQEASIAAHIINIIKQRQEAGEELPAGPVENAIEKFKDSMLPGSKAVQFYNAGFMSDEANQRIKSAAEHLGVNLDEGNAYVDAVRQAKKDGKKKGDEIDGPDGEKITLEKDQKTPLGEFILSYFDRHTGQFPKGETAVLTMVEKEYGEQYIRPAQAFIEQVNNKVAEVMGYREAEPEVQETPELNRISALAGLR